MAFMDKSTSLTLLERVRVQDGEAWGRLVHLYGPLVRYWCGRWGVTGSDADDVTQDVFLVVTNRLGEFQRDQTGGTFRGWLRGMLGNRLKEFWRYRKKRPMATGSSDFYVRVLNQLVDPRHDPRREWERNHQRHAAQRLLARPAIREAIDGDVSKLTAAQAAKLTEQCRVRTSSPPKGLFF